MTSRRILPFANERSFLLDYRILKPLGSGSFGEVWTCRDKRTQQEFAVKIIDKSRVRTPNQTNDILREVGFLNVGQGQHPGVVQLKEVRETNRSIYLVMEMCRGGDLLKLVTRYGKLPQKSAKLIFRHLASALAYCHSKGIIHRDIKPENILFDGDSSCLGAPSSRKRMRAVQPKLADFGLSVVVAPGDTTKGCAGSKFYVAPEMVLGKEYDSRVDTWSLGVVLCAMLTGRLPFTGTTFQDDHGLVKAILHGDLNLNKPHWKRISKGAKALIKQMLEKDPAKRLTSEELVAHPWVADTSRCGFMLNLGRISRRRAVPTKVEAKNVDVPITLSDLEEPDMRAEELPSTLEKTLRRQANRRETVIPAVATDSSEDFFGSEGEPSVSPHGLASPFSPHLKAARCDITHGQENFPHGETGEGLPLRSSCFLTVHDNPWAPVDSDGRGYHSQETECRQMGLDLSTLSVAEKGTEQEG